MTSGGPFHSYFSMSLWPSILFLVTRVGVFLLVEIVLGHKLPIIISFTKRMSTVTEKWIDEWTTYLLQRVTICLCCIHSHMWLRWGNLELSLPFGHILLGVAPQVGLGVSPLFLSQWNGAPRHHNRGRRKPRKMSNVLCTFWLTSTLIGSMVAEYCGQHRRGVLGGKLEWREGKILL